MKVSKNHMTMLKKTSKYLAPVLILAIAWFGFTSKQSIQALDESGKGALGGAAVGGTIGAIASKGSPAGVIGGLAGGALIGGLAGKSVKESRRSRYDDSRNLEKENKRLERENKKLKQQQEREARRSRG